MAAGVLRVVSHGVRFDAPDLHAGVGRIALPGRLAGEGSRWR
jgi:hypothetical protein